MKLLLICCLLAASPDFADSMRVLSTIKSSKAFVFLTRFCYRPVDTGVDLSDERSSKDFGFFDYKVEHKANAKLHLLLYFQGFEQFQKAYTTPASDMDCIERMNMASLKYPLWNEQTYNATDERILTTTSSAYFYGKKANWFFMALANCDESCIRPEPKNLSLGGWAGSTVNTQRENHIGSVLTFWIEGYSASSFNTDRLQAFKWAVVNVTDPNLANTMSGGGGGEDGPRPTVGSITATEGTVRYADGPPGRLGFTNRTVIEIVVLADLTVPHNPELPFAMPVGQVVLNKIELAIDNGEFYDQLVYENRRRDRPGDYLGELGVEAVTIDTQSSAPTFAPTMTPIEDDNYCQGSIDVDVRLHLTNSGDEKSSEFSWDKSGMFQAYITFFVLYTLLGMFAYNIGAGLSARRKFHHTVKLLLLSIFVEWLATGCEMLNLNKYAGMGYGIPFLNSISLYLHHIAQLVLIILLICLAKGWTIVRRKVSISGRMKIGVYGTVYFALVVTALIWRDIGFEPAEVVYYMEAPPGIMLACMNIVAALWFRYAGHTTSRDFKMKKGFYFKFNTIFFIYLLHLPLVTLLAISLPDYSRQKVVEIITMSCALVGHAILLAMYNPNTEYNQSFPFHANTASKLMGRRFQEQLDKTDGGSVSKPGEPQQAVPVGGAGNGTPTAISGGMDADVSAAGKFTLRDDYEKIHYAKMFRLHEALKDRTQTLVGMTKEMDKSFDRIHMDVTSRRIMESMEDDEDVSRRQRSAGKSSSWENRGGGGGGGGGGGVGWNGGGGGGNRGLDNALDASMGHDNEWNKQQRGRGPPPGSPGRSNIARSRSPGRRPGSPGSGTEMVDRSGMVERTRQQQQQAQTNDPYR